MLTRLEGEAHVWLSNPLEPPSVSSSPGSRNLLSSDERERLARIRHSGTRGLFFTGRVLLRAALSRYAAIEPSDWFFRETDLGRPEVAGPAGAPPLRFNLSHAPGLVACLVTREIDCGLDVESLDRPVDAVRIAEHSFGAAEAEELRDLAEPERTLRFFSYWTLKEAYLKARGTGIRLRLDAVEFDLSGTGRVDARFPPHAEERSEDWQFELLRPADRHLLALALKRKGRPDLGVAAWAWTPGNREAREQALAGLGGLGA
jgi:4'-phosphopantetheinyl transferase